MLVAALLSSLLFLGHRGAPVDAWSAAMRLEFDVPLSEFLAASRSATRDGRLDWSTDGCSAPVLGSTGRTFDFSDACRRHDFAYRNLGRLGGGSRWTPALRARVDSRFLADMRTHCGTRPRADRTPCRAWANVYHAFVRQFSGP